MNVNFNDDEADFVTQMFNELVVDIGDIAIMTNTEQIEYVNGKGKPAINCFKDCMLGLKSEFENDIEIVCKSQTSTNYSIPFCSIPLSAPFVLNGVDKDSRPALARNDVLLGRAHGLLLAK